MKEMMKKNEIIKLINKLPSMLYRCRSDDNWSLDFISDGCEELIGYTNEEMLSNSKVKFTNMIHPDDKDWTYEILSDALEKKRHFNFEYRIIVKDGTIKWVWEQGVGVYDSKGKIKYLEGYITDITKQKMQDINFEKELHQKDKELLMKHSLVNEYKKAVDESAIVSKTNSKGIITFVNDAFCKNSGYTKEELLGKSHNILRHSENPNSFFREMWETILNKKIWKGILKNKTKYNKTYYVQMTIVPILEIDGKIKEFIAIRHNVTDLILQEKKIKSQGIEPLTKLPNRQKIMEDLKQSDTLKLLIINIEKFKEINEYYGFDIGDRLLVELSVLLSKKLNSPKVKLYKLPANEFAILTNDLIEKNYFIQLVSELIETVQSHTFEISEHKINIQITAGAAMQKNYFIHAEMAKNHAKATNTKFVLYDDNLYIKEKIMHNIKWTNKIKKAIQEDKVIVFAQPIICNKTNTINKYECLVRMIDDDDSIISPIHFLDIAKHAKLYTTLTQIVITKAIEYFKDKTEYFSINLTLDDILNTKITNFLKNKLHEHKGLSQRLILEIVEDEGIENFEEVSAFIEMMKNLGCKIAIDDFGTGYSNFAYLMRLNVDFIKIDGSIIKNIDTDKNAKIVTELIVSFAQRQNIETIAEFVHKKEIFNILIDMGIDYSQGYYLGKPEKLLINNKVSS